ncbi:hypothetical protein DFAR_330002 [Desulfarculales bacterium]
MALTLALKASCSPLLTQAVRTIGGTQARPTLSHPPPRLPPYLFSICLMPHLRLSYNWHHAWKRSTMTHAQRLATPTPPPPAPRPYCQQLSLSLAAGCPQLRCLTRGICRDFICLSPQ